MNESLLDIMIDPADGAELSLDGSAAGEATLRGPSGRIYPITNGIPRFVATDDAGQAQTAQSFGYKWSRRSTYDSPAMREIVEQQLVERYGFPDASAQADYFATRRRVLDAGCGSALSSSVWMTDRWRSGTAEWIKERIGHLPRTSFVQADLMRLPFRDGTFDAIFSEGVLHHTPSTERAIHALARQLAPDGELFFYVYRKKAPIREFADDHVRAYVSQLPPDQAWDALRPLTRLSQTLAELQLEVDVPEDIPYLGIRSGRYDVQRLLYWHVAKLFWNPRLSFEENNHVNFDWYHPQYAHRQTEDEVRRWSAEAGLDIVRFHTTESGFSVRARWRLRCSNG
jgi:arsenite methyltransferase